MFFTFGNEGWQTSIEFWLYWAITIPSTLLVLLMYLCFANQRVQNFLASMAFSFYRKRAKFGDSESVQASI